MMTALFVAAAPWLLAAQLAAIPTAGVTGWIARKTKTTDQTLPGLTATKATKRVIGLIVFAPAMVVLVAVLAVLFVWYFTVETVRDHRAASARRWVLRNGGLR